MRVFVSYSFVDSELHMITLLLEKLRQSGHVVETADFWDNNNFNISKSDIFIGLITNQSESVNKVLDEWEYAKHLNKKSILLIEEGVQVNDTTISFIRFNRKNPELAINQLIGKKQAPSIKKKSTDVEDFLTIGGIIVGVAALISLLAGTNKK